MTQNKRGFIMACIVIVAAIVLSVVSYSAAAQAVDRSVRTDLAENGMKIESFSVCDGGDGIVINVKAEKETMCAEEIMQMRKLINAVRASTLEYDVYYLHIINSEGQSVYSCRLHSSQPEYNKLSDNTMSESVYGYELKYLCADMDMNLDGYSFYESAGAVGRALYVKVTAASEKCAEALANTYNYIVSLNYRGGDVQRFSVEVADDTGDTAFIVSRDVTYGDTLFWKSGKYATTSTIFD